MSEKQRPEQLAGLTIEETSRFYELQSVFRRGKTLHVSNEIVLEVRALGEKIMAAFAENN